MSDPQLIIMIATVLIFVIMGFSLHRSIKKFEARPKPRKKKKGRNRYMPEVKKPGK